MPTQSNPTKAAEFSPSKQSPVSAPSDLQEAVSEWTQIAPTSDGLFSGCTLWEDPAPDALPSPPEIDFGGSSGIQQYDVLELAGNGVSVTVDPPTDREPSIASLVAQQYSSTPSVTYADGSTLRTGIYEDNIGSLTIAGQACTYEITAPQDEGIEATVEAMHPISDTTLRR
jgi:hypothetical protein